MDIKTYEKIIERESKQFSDRLFMDGKINTISHLKDQLDTKLYDFQIDDYKIRFLTRLKDYINSGLNIYTPDEYINEIQNR